MTREVWDNGIVKLAIFFKVEIVENTLFSIRKRSTLYMISFLFSFVLNDAVEIKQREVDVKNIKYHRVA